MNTPAIIAAIALTVVVVGFAVLIHLYPGPREARRRRLLSHFRKVRPYKVIGD